MTTTIPSRIPANTIRTIEFRDDRGQTGVWMRVRTCRRNATKVNIGRVYGIDVAAAREWVRDVAQKAAARGYAQMVIVDRPLSVADMHAESEYSAWRDEVDAAEAVNEQQADQWAAQWEQIHDEIQAA